MQDIKLAKPTTLLVPSLIVFSVMSRHEYYDKFVRGREYQSIALPLIENSGFFFPYTIEGKERQGQSVRELGSAAEEPIQLKDVVRFFQSKQLAVYFTLDLSMPRLSIESGACDLHDQSLKRAAHCCINNPLTQKYVAHILERSLAGFKEDLGDELRGIVLHVTNNWPMSAQTGRFLLTCFCTHCVTSLKEITHGSLDADWFRGFPNAINLALAETTQVDDDGDEIGGISPVSDIERSMEPDALLDACSQVRGTLPAKAYDKGNFETQRPLFTRWARQLLLYLDAKSQVTLTDIREVFASCKRVLPNARRVLMCEDETYGWTSGLFLEELTGDVADELWFPLAPRALRTDIRSRPLLAHRACYAISAFFDEINMLTDAKLRALVRSDISKRKLRKRLARMLDGALAEVQGEGDSVLPDWMMQDPDAIMIGVDRDLALALRAKVERELGWE